MELYQILGLAGAGFLAAAVVFIVIGLILRSRGRSELTKHQRELKRIEREIAYRQESLKELVDCRERQAQSAPAAKVAAPGQEKDQLFQDVLNSVHDLVIVWNNRLQPTYISPSIEKILGYSKFEFSDWKPDQASLGRMLTHESLATLNRHYGRMIAEGKTVTDESAISLPLVLEVIKSDGSTIWTETQMDLLRGADRRPRGIVSITRDITRLRKEESLYRELVDNSVDVCFALDGKGRFTFLNGAVSSLLGYTPQELMGKSLLEYVHAQDAALLVSKFSAAMDGKSEPVNIFRMIDKGGSTVYVRAVTSLSYEGDEVIGVYGFAGDLSALKRTEAKLRRGEEQYRSLIENMNDITFSLDRNGNYTYASPVAEYVLGYAMDDIVGSPFMRFVHQEDLAQLEEAFAKTIEGQYTLAETRIRKRNGEVMYVRVSARMMDDGGQGRSTTGIMSDITERKKAEIALHKALDEIKMLSVTDSLTGCYNRGYLTEHLPYEIKRSMRYRHPLALIMCDIDHFKEVNDNYGHQAGDYILKEFVKCIRGVIRENMDWLARYGGEEFLIAVGETDLEGAMILAERLRIKVNKLDLEYGGRTMKISASFGVVSCDPARTKEELSADILVSRVDKCLYQAKAAGRDRVVSQDHLLK